MFPRNPIFSFWRYILLSLILAATFFYMDRLLPLGFAGGVPYISLVLVGLWSESRKLIIFNSLLGTVLTVLGAHFSPVDSDQVLANYNRLLANGTLWLTTYFCLMNLRWMEEKYRSELLEKANSRLKKETGYVQLNRDIASFTNLSRSLDDAITYSLKKICAFTGWPVGHLYLLGEDGQTLFPSGIWYLEDKKRFENFREITQQNPLASGEGLPGRVIAQGKAQFILDLKADPNFPRGAFSKEIGVVSGFGFPILSEDTVVGVMEFFSSIPMEPEKRLVEVMESIGVMLGRVIERTRADQNKESYSVNLRQLYHKLDSIREEESKRIARDVHDDLGQVLTTLKIELSLLDNKLSEKKVDVKENMRMMFSLIEKNIQVVKKISRDLRPPVLDSLSLTEAIDWQGTLFQEKTGVKFSLSTSPSQINLDAPRSITLFRIFQECLTNISRHSGASDVHVDIIDQDKNLVMRVRDNGKGIAEKEAKNNLSLGVLGMKERAQMWGGEVEIAGVKNEGTTVTIKIKSD
ncbi:MAG: GAF domain-containing sensor histidine kinase [Nitrospinae bacterium]|nr:GAF domain-containing sensor histidine kinase [Nitrospinota bacterium]MDA1109887.1 GAF domain-containing sensor histidine kinase [Nitrospinota bacterium]